MAAIDDVLAALAQTPNADTESGPPGDPGQWNDFVEQPAPPDPGQWGQYVDPALGTPSIAGHGPEMPTLSALASALFTPGSPQAQHPNSPVPPGTSVGRSQSVRSSSSSSHSGVPGGPKAVDDMFSDAHRKADAVYAMMEPGFANDAARANAHYQDISDAIAGRTQQTQDYHKQVADLLDRQNDFMDMSAHLDQLMENDARVHREQTLTQYRGQLAGVAQLVMQSGNPLGGLSTGQALGLAGAEFAEGFLAPMGIHLNVTTAVDRWVDRSIQEHQAKISNARQGANDTLHLYDLASQDAHDAADARARYRGMVIEGLKFGIQSSAARYQSNIANQEAAEKLARLQLDQDATLNGIGEKARKEYLDLTKQFADEAKDSGLLKIQHDAQGIAYMNAVSGRMEAQTNRMKLDATKAPPGNLNFSDPEPETMPVAGDDGKPVLDAKGRPVTQQVIVNRWRVDPTIKDEGIKTKVYEGADKATKAYANTYDKLNTYMGLRQKAYEAIGGPGILGNKAAFLKSPVFREAEQAKNDLVQSIVYMKSGKTTPETEFKRISDLLPDESFFQKGNNAQQVINYREYVRREANNEMRGAGLVPIKPSDPEYRARLADMSPGIANNYLASQNKSEPIPGIVGTAEAEIVAKDSEEIGTNKPSGPWAAFQDEQLRLNPNEKIKLGQPHYAIAIDHLGAAILDPEKTARLLSVRDEDVTRLADGSTPLSDAATEVLTRMGHGGTTDSGKIPYEGQSYAVFMKHLIDTDPKAAREMFENGPGRRK